MVLFASNDEGKVPFVATLTDAAIERGLKAGDLVKEFGAKVGGRGGGKPQLAQGSGSEPAGIIAGLEAVNSAITAAVQG